MKYIIAATINSQRFSVGLCVNGNYFLGKLPNCCTMEAPLPKVQAILQAIKRQETIFDATNNCFVEVRTIIWEIEEELYSARNLTKC